MHATTTLASQQQLECHLLYVKQHAAVMTQQMSQSTCNLLVLGRLLAFTAFMIATILF